MRLLLGDLGSERRFDSVAGLLAATPEEWLTVPGIGRECARSLDTALFGLFRDEVATARAPIRST